MSATELKGRWTYPARWNALAEARATIEAFGRDAGCSDRLAFNLALAVEELFSNTIKYGYGQESSAPITVGISISGDKAVMEFADEAAAFNPLEDAPRPDTDLPARDRPVGGLGVHLVRTLSETATYARIDGWNRLELLFVDHREGMVG